jgi:hypothetical protein
MKNVITMVAFNLGINQDKLKSKEKCMYVCMYVWSWIIFYQQWKHTRVPKKKSQILFFLHINFLSRCVHKMWWKYCELWVHLKTLIVGLTNSLKIFNKWWKLIVRWVYFEPKSYSNKIWKTMNIFWKWS